VLVDPEGLLVGLGQALRELRTARGLSQEQLSLETGVHRNYIGGIERAERQPTVEVIARLGQALGARPSQILIRAEELAE
jgi:transcriptional regulator with XRE-family HTH domain